MAEKVTIKEFEARLKDYPNAGAARKAVGRFGGWSEKLKTQARNMIDKQFGAATAPVKRGPKPKKTAKVPAKAKVATRARKREDAPLMLQDAGLSLTVGRDIPASFQAVRNIQNLAVVANSITGMTEKYPTLKAEGLLLEVVDGFNKAVKILNSELKDVSAVVEASAEAPKKRGRPPTVKVSKSNGEGTMEPLPQVQPHPVASTMAEI
jgi:hypothetical protein